MKKWLAVLLSVLMPFPTAALAGSSPQTGAPQWIKDQAARTDLDRSRGFVEETRQAHGATEGDALIRSLHPQSVRMEWAGAGFIPYPSAYALDAWFDMYGRVTQTATLGFERGEYLGFMGIVYIFEKGATISIVRGNTKGLYAEYISLCVQSGILRQVYP